MKGLIISNATVKGKYINFLDNDKELLLEVKEIFGKSYVFIVSIEDINEMEKINIP